jgi:hypothetical protein
VHAPTYDRRISLPSRYSGLHLNESFRERRAANANANDNAPAGAANACASATIACAGAAIPGARQCAARVAAE